MSENYTRIVAQGVGEPPIVEMGLGAPPVIRGPSASILIPVRIRFAGRAEFGGHNVFPDAAAWFRERSFLSPGIQPGWYIISGIGETVGVIGPGTKIEVKVGNDPWRVADMKSLTVLGYTVKPL